MAGVSTGSPAFETHAETNHSQAIALAAEIEQRWAQFKAGNSTARPSVNDIREALRTLLAIGPKDERFPRAWAAFVRLRKIERDAGA